MRGSAIDGGRPRRIVSKSVTNKTTNAISYRRHNTVENDRLGLDRKNICPIRALTSSVAERRRPEETRSDTVGFGHFARSHARHFRHDPDVFSYIQYNV